MILPGINVLLFFYNDVNLIQGPRVTQGRVVQSKKNGLCEYMWTVCDLFLTYSFENTPKYILKRKNKFLLQRKNKYECFSFLKKNIFFTRMILLYANRQSFKMLRMLPSKKIKETSYLIIVTCAV